MCFIKVWMDKDTRVKDVKTSVTHSSWTSDVLLVLKVILKCHQMNFYFVCSLLLWATYRLFNGASFFCFLFITAGTQVVSSVQSACKPQLQPVENLEKSQDSCLPGRWHVHFFCPALQSHGCSKRIFLTRCLPKVVPPVFWMCRNTITSSPLMLKSTSRVRSRSVKLNLDAHLGGLSSSGSNSRYRSSVVGSGVGRAPILTSFSPVLKWQAWPPAGQIYWYPIMTKRMAKIGTKIHLLGLSFILTQGNCSCS